MSAPERPFRDPGAARTGHDPRAVIDPTAVLGARVTVGPFAVIEEGVEIGDGTRIDAHAIVRAGTVLGRDNRVHPLVVLGDDPQDLAYDGAPTRLVIGDRNVFREGFTAHRGTRAGSETVIGSDGFFMSNSHVGHNCRLDDRVVLASGAVLGGHVVVGERVFVGGNAAIHQHVRVGRLAFLRGGAVASRDLPPFCIASEVNRLRAVNVVGLRRSGMTSATIQAIRRAYRIILSQRRNLRRAIVEFTDAEKARPDDGAREAPLLEEVRELLDFLAASRRGVVVGARLGRGRADSDPEGDD